MSSKAKSFEKLNGIDLFRLQHMFTKEQAGRNSNTADDML